MSRWSKNMREIPTEMFHACWFSTRPKATSESPKEATNESAENGADINEALGEDAQKESDNRADDVRCKPCNDVVYQLNESTIGSPRNSVSLIKSHCLHGPSIRARDLSTCHLRNCKNWCPLHQVGGKCAGEWAFAWHFNSVRPTLLHINVVLY